MNIDFNSFDGLTNVMGEQHRVAFDIDCGDKSGGSALTIYGVSRGDAVAIIEQLGSMHNNLAVDPQPAQVERKKTTPAKPKLVVEEPREQLKMPIPVVSKPPPGGDDNGSSGVGNGAGPSGSNGNGGNGALMKANKLRDVLIYLLEHGNCQTADSLVSACKDLKDSVPVLQRVADLDDRVRRAAEVLGVK